MLSQLEAKDTTAIAQNGQVEEWAPKGKNPESLASCVISYHTTGLPGLQY